MNKVREIVEENGKINIRPSSIADVYRCPMRWYHTHIADDMDKTPVGCKRVAGTAIHGGVQAFWQAVKDGKPPIKPSDMMTSALEALNAQLKEDEVELEGLDFESVQMSTPEKFIERIEDGVAEFYNTFLPMVGGKYDKIPIGIEEKIKVEITGNPVVGSMMGTVDLLFEDRIVDLKTTSQSLKIHPEDHPNTSAKAHLDQLSAYTLLARSAYGDNLAETLKHDVHYILLGKKEVEVIDHSVIIDESLAVEGVNILAKKLKILYDNPSIDVDVLFSPNPSNFYCSKKCCGYYDRCIGKHMR